MATSRTPRTSRVCIAAPAALWLGAAALFVAPVARADGRARVVSIGDGDSLRLRRGGALISIRLACIDAPETAQSPWGGEARRQLQTLLPIGSAVELHRIASDRYGRTVAELRQGGRSINQALVARGAAFVYWSFLSGCDRNAYARLEQEARALRLGVWAVDGGITRPWAFRQARRAEPRFSSQAAAGPLQAGRFTCRQIGSWSRAQELLRQGHAYLDRDGDGEACESLRG